MSAKKSSRSVKGNKKKPVRSTKSTASNTPKKVVATSSPKKEKSVVAKKVSSKIKEDTQATTLPFSRMNYILLAVGVGIITLGFFLMSLDNFVDATQFSVSLYIAPIVVIAGFAEIIYAIMYSPKNSSPAEEGNA